MNYQVYIPKHIYTYTYSYNEKLDVGTFCKVNFRNKEVIGIIIRESLESDLGNFKIKEIKEILNYVKIPENIIKLITFINDYYITDYNSTMKLIGPYEKMDIKRMEELEKEEVNLNVEIKLNSEQENVFYEIINSNEKIFLIHGVTGSGKTQVYLKLIQEALSRGKSSIFLIPEISLTSQMKENFKKIFGNNFSLIHSKNSVNNKSKEWEKLYKGYSKIVIGARSALFSPVKDLEYIIIDEEHENTYKQEDNARYHVRNVAIKRAIIDDAKVILGSATPTIETYFLAKENKIKLLNLKNRYNNAKLPETEIVNLEEEKSLLSEKLLNEMKQRLEKNEQIMLILNRKSHSVLVKCIDCKEKIKCPRCSTNLHYYKSKNILKCNQCEYSKVFKECCTNCKSKNIELLGVGIEKLLDDLDIYFGKENILRMDSSVLNTDSKIKIAFNDFYNKKYNILIGTQMIAKGFHFPDLTLVAVINADQLLIQNDFRANEKTFQLIMQSAGRAGREEKLGNVLIQTYNPNSMLINNIIKNDYISFYNQELILRKILNLPPFTKLIKILISSKNEKNSEKKANEVYSILFNEFNNIEYFRKANIYMIDNRYRYVIYIKTNLKEFKKNRSLLVKVKNMSNNSRERIIIDIDPFTID